MTNPETPLDLDAIRARQDAALTWLREGYSYDDNFTQSAFLIRDDVPALLAALASVTAERDAYRDEALGFMEKRDEMRELAAKREAELIYLRAELPKAQAWEKRYEEALAQRDRAIQEHGTTLAELAAAREQAKQAQAELRDAKLTIAARDAALDASAETHRIAQQIVAATPGATPEVAS